METLAGCIIEGGLLTHWHAMETLAGCIIEGDLLTLAMETLAGCNKEVAC